MRKFSARDAGLIIASGTTGAATALIARLPHVQDENSMLGRFWRLIGSGVAVIAGLIVLARQFETADERHLRTVRELLLILHISGMTLKTQDAPLDPAKHVSRAFSALLTVE